MDNSIQVEERKLIEAVYGVDLSHSRAIIYEFMLPLTAAGALRGDPSVIPKVESGVSFWLGMLINDNDIPGSDFQKYLLWPATYGNFNLKESGAIATFE